MPPVPGFGVPDRVAVPLPGVKVRPAGTVPLCRVMPGAGNPLAVTLKLLFVPTMKVALLALVKAEVWFTVRVKLWVPFAPTPLLTAKVRL